MTTEQALLYVFGLLGKRYFTKRSRDSLDTACDGIHRRREVRLQR